MYGIKEWEDGHEAQASHFRAPHIFATRTQAEARLAEWLQKEQPPRNSDEDRNALLFAYGVYVEPTDAELVAYLLYLYKGESLAQVLAALDGTYDTRKDEQWYRWPYRIGAYSCDGCNWQVIELNENTTP